MTPSTIKIGFGGGCHWCTEAVFSSLIGISNVQQGFIKSHPPNDQYSEGVLIEYDPEPYKPNEDKPDQDKPDENKKEQAKEQQISLSKLIEIHLRTHASFSAHSMRDKYRSAIYVENDAMAERCYELLHDLQAGFSKPLVTQVLRTVHFKRSSESYIDYYATNPDRPFCVTYIEPKLAMLRREYGSHLKTEAKRK